MRHLHAPPAAPATGLVLTGGGARAAYQVGILQAIADLRLEHGGRHAPNPFPILTGTSAGAINAAALACAADDFDHGVRRIVHVWSRFEAQQVYHADAIHMLRSGARWLTLMSLGWMLARWRYTRPRSLLDNAPLGRLLREMVPLERLPGLFQDGHLRALAVTASSYSSGEHITFFDAHEDFQPWVRSQRRALRARITHAHLLASSAIPFIFPAQAVDIEGHREYFGDGSMRQTAPIAPAIHLGAERLLVVGAGRQADTVNGAPARARPPPLPRSAAHYPALGQIAGHALSSIFLDALPVDVERLLRINTTLSLIPQAALQDSPLRPIQLLFISPSEPLDDIAARHLARLPATVRALLSTLGIDTSAAGGRAGARDAALASYLLFEHGYTRELIALGRADALARQAELCEFFGWHGGPPAAQGSGAGGLAGA
ncbi:Patatin [Melaminivora suipulveris]|uniref:Patatin n=1 Tax=Melaminivora suipulveris TaxID=2109913 RepID=A0A2R3QE26_9BURK|nr:patatin-like phospholipase family protein [Melaminivora suipulveris]AVO50028.1 Patatin [Melaminivora suipulveris]